MEHCIFHVDVNSAFLSWSAVKKLSEDPDALDLRTVPSIVGGDITTRHGVVTAKSIPAKKYGIQTGEPVASALRKCPGLILVKSDFAAYRQYSKAFIAILKTYTPLVEQVSIDEAFLDMTEPVRAFAKTLPDVSDAAVSPDADVSPCPEPKSGAAASDTSAVSSDMPVLSQEIISRAAQILAARIRDEVRTTLKFTVNVGISENKLLAKMASDFSKPDKTHTLWVSEVPSKMWMLTIGSLFGCGTSTAARLSSFGIRTIGDAAKTELKILQSILGEKSGEYIFRASRGLSDSPVNSERESAKSYSNETTTPEDITEDNYKTSLPPLLNSLSESVARRMQRDSVRALTIGVMVKTGEFKRHSRQITLDRSTNDAAVIRRTAEKLMEELLLGENGLFRNHETLRLIGVSAQNLDNGSYTQVSLFDWEQELKAEKEAQQKAEKAAARKAAEEKKKAEIEAAFTRKKQKLDLMMQQINTRCGAGKVHRGTESPVSGIPRSPEDVFPDRSGRQPFRPDFSEIRSLFPDPSGKRSRQQTSKNNHEKQKPSGSGRLSERSTENENPDL